MGDGSRLGLHIAAVEARRRVRRTLALLILTSGVAACATRAAAIPEPVRRARNCDDGSAAVTWAWHHDPAQRRTLDAWCESVGAPVVHVREAGLMSGANATTVGRLVVVSWNVHVGAGRVSDLVRLIVRRTPRPPVGDVGVVLLLQETFRRGAGVPAYLPSGTKVPSAIRPGRPAADIAELAEDLRMSVAYVPSMRNGPSTSVYEREDRGSAILSTEPIGDIRAVELPFGSRRRVAVMATVTPRGGRVPALRVASGHLDVLRGTGGQSARLAAYLDEIKDAGTPVILGIDTNAIRGSRSGAVSALARSLPMVTACGSRRTGPWIARLDFFFSNLPPAFAATCETLSERYGSDHVPLVLTIDYDTTRPGGQP